MDREQVEYMLSLQLENTYVNIDNIECESRAEQFQKDQPFLLPKSFTKKDIQKVANVYYGATDQTQARMRKTARKLSIMFPEEYIIS
jgi:hypothetical protein